MGTRTKDQSAAKEKVVERALTPEEIAQIVRSWRKTILCWKQETLAELASVSLSVIERIERGVKVSRNSYRRVAGALGFQDDDFTRIRRIPTTAEATSSFREQFQDYVEVPVQPVRTQPQIASLLDAYGILLDDRFCDSSVQEEVAVLKEYFEDCSWIMGMEKDPQVQTSSKKVRRRQVYRALLSQIRNIEKQGYTAVCTVYNAEFEDLSIPIGVVSFSPRSSDPGATKRRSVLVPRSIDLRAGLD